jgi:hypothetical protein
MSRVSAGGQIKVFGETPHAGTQPATPNRLTPLRRLLLEGPAMSNSNGLIL